MTASVKEIHSLEIPSRDGEVENACSMREDKNCVLYWGVIQECPFPLRISYLRLSRFDTDLDYFSNERQPC